MELALLEKCRSLLTELGIISSEKTVLAHTLAGGVASDIAMVQFDNQKLCVKFALPKLKVEADWFAPVHRNNAEYAWLEVLAKVAPANAVKLFGKSQRLHGFAMEFLEGDDTYLWKTALLTETSRGGEASLVGELVGRIHAASTSRAFDTKPFQNKDDFKAIRIEPYLLHTALAHNNIAHTLHKIATQLYESSRVLCHGDVSPKNTFLRSSGPVILDAECATMGDASFDPAFCINHLILKAVHLPDSKKQYLINANQLWQAYYPFVTWEPVADLEIRICQLLPALMLARIDGKSPVEYLTESEQDVVRSIALQMIKSPSNRMEDLLHRVGELI